MPKPYTFTAHIEDGHLKVGLRVLQALREALKHWQRCPVVITVEKAHATRSLDANALYWVGYVKPVADYTWYSAKLIHALYKKKFLPKQRIEIVDKKSGVVVDEQDLEQLTTTTLTNNEFSDYLHDIAEWVLDTFHGCVTVGSKREHAA